MIMFTQGQICLRDEARLTVLKLRQTTAGVDTLIADQAVHSAARYIDVRTLSVTATPQPSSRSYVDVGRAAIDAALFIISGTRIRRGCIYISNTPRSAVSWPSSCACRWRSGEGPDT